ncbi:TRAP transporter substrate-binding protein [Pannonibacter carbonis]|uniref:TRAP transporter substrate-binding protein n=1 Tax=Pannonibacter carbonis TaxID=2067569 RepID=UPI000D0EA842|nr:TRAP transporter substrate-binding protein [Pannonibacter carbonis]
MRLKANTLRAGLISAVLTMAFSMTAAHAETELVLSSWLPPKHPLVENAIKPWAAEVEQATEGRVKIRVLAKPLGAPPAHFDMAKDGVADITYGLHSFTNDDRFLRSRVGQFSFLGNDAVTVSRAYWEVYTGDLDAASEHKGTKLLSVFAHGPGMIHNNKIKIEKPEDFKGLKLRTPGGYIADLMQDVGVTTQFMGPGEVYEKLSRGVIDGVTFPMEALQAFKLSDHLSYTMAVPGGIYNTSWFLVMNEAKWNSLSDADRAAIEIISGPAFAERAGKVWDEADAGGADLLASSKIELHSANAAVMDAIKASAAKYEAAWAAQVSAQGLDGKAALEKMRQISGVTY